MFKVTATQLPRILTCNGSRLLSHVPSPDIDDAVKDEGNAADWLTQQVVSGQHLLEELVDRKAPNGVYITTDMADNLREYLEWVVGKGEIEQGCSYQGNGWEVAGRADHVWYNSESGTLYVSDFKYGWKIVDVEDNWTLISHAVAWSIRNGMYPQSVEFRIYQPRPYHPDGTMRSYVRDAAYLQTCHQQIVSTLDNLNDTLVTSKHCYKCPSMAICPAAQVAGMNAIDVSHKAYESQPTNDQVEFLIEETRKAMDVLKQNLNAYEELATHRIKTGQHFKNYALQTDYGRETWREDVTPEFVELMTGLDVAKRTLPTPNQVIKAGANADFVKSLTTKPSKGVKLVKCSANEKAAKLFNRK